MSIEKKSFGTLSDGREVTLYTLENKNGLTLDPLWLPDCQAADQGPQRREG